MDSVFPFSAIVGQSQAKTALILGLIDSRIGGVLLSGQKGTAKTSLVRSIASLLPELPIVELPLNATEDRLTGAINIEKALTESKREYEPGLLSVADGGLLYVDEVNLLESHLVDMLLDVSATGMLAVEREGISYRQKSSFLLVGSMNPEEGELRPQFLDRFGLYIPVEHITCVSQRKEIIKRRIEFETDRDSFCKRYERDELLIREQIIQAKKNIDSVVLGDDVISEAVRIADSCGVSGHRAEIVMCLAARAMAAFTEEDRVSIGMLHEVAPWALYHRLDTGLSEHPDVIAARIRAAISGEEGDKSDVHKDESVEMTEDMLVPGAAAAGSIVFDFLKKKLLKKIAD